MPTLLSLVFKDTILPCIVSAYVTVYTFLQIENNFLYLNIN